MVYIYKRWWLYINGIIVIQKSYYSVSFNICMYMNNFNNEILFSPLNEHENYSFLSIKEGESIRRGRGRTVTVVEHYHS